MEKFGERLRLWRKSKGVTTWAIEKMAGVDRSNLRQIEKGERPASDDTLRKIASIPEMEIDFDTLRAWRRLDQATFDEKIALLKTLTGEQEILPILEQLLSKKPPP